MALKSPIKDLASRFNHLWLLKSVASFTNVLNAVGRGNFIASKAYLCIEPRSTELNTDN